MLSDEEFDRRAARIRLLCLDVDGTLTDGAIVVNGAGEETKVFSVRDGFAIKAWQMFGHKVVIITGRTCAAVERRAKELALDGVYQNAPNKIPAFKEMLATFAVGPDEVCYAGDDLPDVPLLRSCGLGVAPADAAAEVKAAADWVTENRGGRGAVREAIERLLTAQGKWREVVARYDRPALEDAATTPAEPGEQS